MMNKSVACVVLAIVLFFFTTASCDAQLGEGSSNGIQAGGTALIERLPERLRMTVEVSVSGKNLPDAMDKLKARRAKIEQQLQTLSAIKGSTRFASLKLGDGQDNQRQQMEMMMRQRLMQTRGKKATKKEPAAKPVVVSVKLTADWQFTAKSDEELFLEAQKLQDAIKAADLAGTKEAAAEKTAEEEELAEESPEVELNFGGEQGPKPGEPAFAFVLQITEKERKQALADAYKSARKSAEELAQVAGFELGELRNLQSTGTTDSGDPSDRYNIYGGMLGMLRGQTAGNEEGPEEAIGTNAGPVRYRVTVTTTFAAK